MHNFGYNVYTLVVEVGMFANNNNNKIDLNSKHWDATF